MSSWVSSPRASSVPPTSCLQQSTACFAPLSRSTRHGAPIAALVSGVHAVHSMHLAMHMATHMAMHMPCAACTSHARAMCIAVHMPCSLHTRCADYGVVSGYNDDFPQRGLGDRGDEQVLPTEGVPARGRPNRGGSAPVRDFNKNMFQC